MLSVRFFIVVAVLGFMLMAGIRRMDLLAVLPWGTAVFILAWTVRPLKELRSAMDAFSKKILQKKKANITDVLLATTIVLVTWLLVPVVAYGIGYLLSIIWKVMIP